MKRYDITLIKLVNNNKKYKVVIKDRVDNTKKTVSFGDSSYPEDYLIHKDDKRKENYIKRHAKNEDWNNIYTAGFWSKWLLWNQTTLNKSIRDVEKLYDCNITVQ